MANVLLIGSGGREHALGWKLAQSNRVERIFFAPGNGGTQGLLGKGENVHLRADSAEYFGAIEAFVKEQRVDLVLIGPEAPLSLGLVDALNNTGITRVFGPTEHCARLESDKFFSHHIMKTLGIPQAKGFHCSNEEQARDAIASLAQSGHNAVLKARGLAAGKGVIVCNDEAHAHTAMKSLFTDYGGDLLVSERLAGPEFSVFAVCDGTHARLLPMALQDHKRLLDGDEGPNTGGMGAYGPATIATDEILAQVQSTVIAPILAHFAANGTPYRGFLYAGMMLTKDGPKVLEFNVRFGDPECQPAMLMLDEDLYAVLTQAVTGELTSAPLACKAGAACCVVLASQGYPKTYPKGLAIRGIAEANERKDVLVFHAGTRRENGQLVTSGGRVLGVTAYASTGLKDAQQRAYQALTSIEVEGNFHYRTDIASQAL